jgi:hypothetical protein
MKRCRCRKSFTQQGYIPTRVLEVVNPETILLIDSRLCGPDKLTGSYVTLSHCWGPPPHSATLTRENIADFLTNGVPINLMPKTFRDAFKFVSRLGPEVKYIWIDSLCIIQGDPEDWNRESVLMAKNYRNAYFNLSATAAHDSSEGLFFNHNPGTIMPDLLELPAPESSKNSDQPNQVQTYTIVDSYFWHDRVSLGPVCRRGWIIQEMLLALRVVHFLGDQIAWECGCVQAAESFPGGILFGASLYPDLYNLRKAFGIHRPDITSYLMSVGASGEVQRVMSTWNSIVQVYTTTLLTEPADKLVAISGIAELTSSRVQTPYIAGLWKSNLVSQLAWRVKSEYGSDPSTISTRPQSYRAPSFSWASADAQFGVKFPSSLAETEKLIEIAATHVQLLQPSPFGQIAKDAYIDVLCRLYPITIVKNETTDQPAIEWTWTEPKSGYPHHEGRGLISTHWDCLANDLEGIMNHHHKGVFFMPLTRRKGRSMEALILRQTMQLGTFSRLGQVEFGAYPNPLWDNELVGGEQRTIRIV